MNQNSFLCGPLDEDTSYSCRDDDKMSQTETSSRRFDNDFLTSPFQFQNNVLITLLSARGRVEICLIYIEDSFAFIILALYMMHEVL